VDGSGDGPSGAGSGAAGILKEQAAGPSRELHSARCGLPLAAPSLTILRFSAGGKRRQET